MTTEDRQRILDDLYYVLLPNLTDKQLMARHAQIAVQVTRRLLAAVKEDG